MSEESGADQAERLVDEAWDAYIGDRYVQALAAAQRGIASAELQGNLVTLVRGLSAAGCSFQATGDHISALESFSRILALAGDEASAGRLNDHDAAWAIADAYASWVDSAREIATVGAREQLRVLDAGERWLAAAGRQDWRCLLLLARALVHRSLGELDTAIGLAREGLALRLQHGSTPGWMLGSYQINLADMLREAGRGAEARQCYLAVLDDPDSAPSDRHTAHAGLAGCALAAGDLDTALAEARIAAGLAEQYGDALGGTPLATLARVHRARGELADAWRAASMNLEAAGRLGGHARQYYATRLAVDIALDRSDLAAARRLLGELEVHAVAMDSTTGLTLCADETAARHRRAIETAASPSWARAGRAGQPSQPGEAAARGLLGRWRRRPGI